MSDPLAKAAESLRRRLAEAAPDTSVAAVLELASPPAPAAGVPLGGTPESLARRSAARAATAAELAGHTAPTIAALERLGLSPRGGRYVPYVAVCGVPAALIAALQLSGVASAALDDPADPPTRREDAQ